MRVRHEARAGTWSILARKTGTAATSRARRAVVARHALTSIRKTRVRAQVTGVLAARAALTGGAVGDGLSTGGSNTVSGGDGGGGSRRKASLFFDKEGFDQSGGRLRYQAVGRPTLESEQRRILGRNETLGLELGPWFRAGGSGPRSHRLEPQLMGESIASETQVHTRRASKLGARFVDCDWKNNPSSRPGDSVEYSMCGNWSTFRRGVSSRETIKAQVNKYFGQN